MKIKQFLAWTPHCVVLITNWLVNIWENFKF